MGSLMGRRRGRTRFRSFGLRGPAVSAWFRPVPGSESSGSRLARHIGRGQMDSFARRHRQWTGPLAGEMRTPRRGSAGLATDGRRTSESPHPGQGGRRRTGVTCRDRALRANPEGQGGCCDGAEEHMATLVVTRCHGPVVLQLVDSPLDGVALSTSDTYPAGNTRAAGACPGALARTRTSATDTFVRLPFSMLEMTVRGMFAPRAAHLSETAGTVSPRRHARTSGAGPAACAPSTSRRDRRPLPSARPR